MKKILILMMILMLCMSAASCGSKDSAGNEGPSDGAGESMGEGAPEGAPEGSAEYAGTTGFLMPDCVCSAASTSSEAIDHELYDAWYVIRYEKSDTCTDAYFEYEEYLKENFTAAGEQKYSDSDGNVLLLAARMSDVEAYFGFGITYAK